MSDSTTYVRIIKAKVFSLKFCTIIRLKTDPL